MELDSFKRERERERKILRLFMLYQPHINIVLLCMQTKIDPIECDEKIRMYPVVCAINKVRS